MQMNRLSLSQGAEVQPGGGVRYRTWAPGKEVGVIVNGRREIPLGREPNGYWSAIDREGSAGDRYQYRLVGKTWPDPASHFNPDGVHGAAQVIDPRHFNWNDAGWTAPPLSDLVIYELHIGAFTPRGTFLAAIEKLEYLAAFGITAIEIMPVADFPGERNWGYDGVSLYAPARVYGTPDEFRALIDAAHGHGLAVLLDVVYNHLGPDGNYLGVYSPDYFSPTHKTPWGDGFHFELQPVRDFFVQNVDYWRRDFHIDGFRLDATHAIEDASERHLLAEISERAHSLGAFVIAEDERNEASLVQPRAKGGMGLDAIWADDFHHVLRVMLTGTREGYYKAYAGTPEELAATLDHGWLLAGENRERQRLHQPGEADEIEPKHFVICISNHDQIGNQALGTRLNQAISGPAFRAASALLCLAPYTPLIFMGQEWAAATPFQFFTDHEPELGRRVTAGRREEFRGFSAFRDPAAREKIPDPQSRETFLRSKLNWNEIEEVQHAGVLRLYHELLRLRREFPVLRDRSRQNFRVLEPVGSSISVRFGGSGTEQWLIVANLKGDAEIELPINDESGWELVLSSNDLCFNGDVDSTSLQPETRVFRRGEAVRSGHGAMPRLTARKRVASIAAVNPKILTRADLTKKSDEIRAAHQRLVLTNGCFDLLHVGHVRYLQEAKALGDVLAVAVNDDDSVRQLKGEGRPLNSAADRAEVLAALECVDLVTIFPELRATQVIEAVKPAVYVKGGDYTVDTLNPEEVAALKNAGAEIKTLPLVPGKSTSALLEKMRR